MTTKRAAAPEPDRVVGIPEETGPVRQEPEVAPPPPLPEPPRAEPVPPEVGAGFFHRIVTDEDVEALRAIAFAAHAVAQAGGLSTNDPKVARLHTALTFALYGV